MTTDDLIATLATDPARVAPRAVERRLAVAMAAGGAATFAVVLLWLGPRPDLAEALHQPTIWMKWAYTASVGLIALLAVRHLSRPDSTRGAWPWALVLPIGALAAIAFAQVASTPRAEWPAAWLGHSWRECPFRIIGLSAPIFAGMVWAFRRFAPTRLRLTGAVAGLASGGAAATLYGFACPETSALFVVTWYTLGIAAATALGALAGPRLLRW